MRVKSPKFYKKSKSSLRSCSKSRSSSLKVSADRDTFPGSDATNPNSNTNDNNSSTGSTSAHPAWLSMSPRQRSVYGIQDTRGSQRISIPTRVGQTLDLSFLVDLETQGEGGTGGPTISPKSIRHLTKVAQDCMGTKLPKQLTYSEVRAKLFKNGWNVVSTVAELLEDQKCVLECEDEDEKVDGVNLKR